MSIDTETAVQEMLLEWTGKESDAATGRKLYEALLRIKLKDIAHDNAVLLLGYKGKQILASR